jgi:hypothetical protein
MLRKSAPSLVALAAALLLPGSPAFAGVATIAVAIPLQGSVIPYERPGQKVIFSATVFLQGDSDGWREAGGPWIRVTISKKGGGSIVRYPALGKLPLVIEEIPIEDLLALIPGKFTDKQQFEWTLLVSDQRSKDFSGVIEQNHIPPKEAEEMKKRALSSVTQVFTLAGPPDLAVSADADFGSPWPKDVAVKNVGGSRSQPSSLEVTFTLRDASDPSVKSRCPAADFHKVHTLLALDPDAKVTFDVPKPAGAPAPGHSAGGVHKVVTCNYVLDAALSQDTNKADPNAANDKLHKIVSVDVPLN